MALDDVLGIDVGGTFIKSAPVDVRRGEMLADTFQVRTPEPATPENVRRSLREILDHFTWQGPVGLGFPGVVRAGVVYTAINLHDAWVGVNAETLLTELLDTPNHVINDADAAGLAEMTFGAGVTEGALATGTVLLITLGTGIGSALFVNRNLVLNTEFGHIYSEEGIEAEKYAAASVRERENMSWEVWGGRVTWFLNIMERLVSPDLIILGGGVIEAFDKFQEYLHTKARVVPARMGNQAGLVGAAYAVKHYLPEP